MKTVSGFSIFETYWNSLRGDNRMPLKSDFDPVGVSSLMSQMSVFELRSNSHLHVRLIGSSLFEQGKASQTGINQFDIIDPAQKNMMSRVLDDLLIHPCMVGFSTLRTYRSGRQVHTQGNAFPFEDSNGEARFMIIVFDIDRDELRLIDDDDVLTQVEYTEIEFQDIGCGIPDWSFAVSDIRDVSFPWYDDAFAEFLSYWRSLERAGEEFPSRNSFNPMRLPKLLPHLWVAERYGDEVTSRLIGTALTNRDSMHLENGSSFRELACESDYDRFLEVLRICEDEKRMCYITTKRNLGEIAQGYHMLLLPFRREEDDHQQFIALEFARAGVSSIAEPSSFPVYDINYTILDLDRQPVQERASAR